MFSITVSIICFEFVVGLLENCDIKALKCDFLLESHRELKSCLDMVMIPPPPPPHYNVDVDCTKFSIITMPETSKSSSQGNISNWPTHTKSASSTTGNFADANQTFEKTNFTSTLTTEAATKRPVPLPITTTRARNITTPQAPIADPMSSFATKRPPIITRWTSFTTHRTKTNVFDTPCTPVNSVPIRKIDDMGQERGGADQMVAAARSCEGVRHVQYYPNMEDQCRSYYVCDSGYLHRMSCPPFTRFSREVHTCDWEHHVPCV